MALRKGRKMVNRKLGGFWGLKRKQNRKKEVPDVDEKGPETVGDGLKSGLIVQAGVAGVNSHIGNHGKNNNFVLLWLDHLDCLSKLG
jgi:hypothetical protein